MRGLIESGCLDLVAVLAPDRAYAACRAALHQLINVAEPDGDASNGPAPIGAAPEAEPPAGTRVRVLACGPSRTEPVRLFSRSGEVAGDDIVLVHDPARAFTPAGPVCDVVAAIRAGAPAAVPVEPVTDTIKVAGPDGVVTGTRDRSGLRCVQSPQGFRGEVLLRSAAAGQVVPRERVHTVRGHPHGLRVVSEFDFTVAEALIVTGDTEHPA